MLEENNTKKTTKKKSIFRQNKLVTTIVLVVVINLILSAGLVGIGLSTYNQWAPWVKSNILGQKVAGVEQVNNAAGGAADNEVKQNEVKIVQEDSVVADVVERVSPAVVSIIVTKDLPKIEQYYEEYSPFGDFFGDDFKFTIPRYRQNGTEEQEIGGGTGFVVTSDGLIITNRHVVEDEEAKYTVLFNDETKYEAQVLARDSVNDVAILKIDKKDLTAISLGDSTKLKVGQTVIAIGNALGEFRNTVSRGIISGLQRDITASSSFGQSEELSGVIQTDAAINPGNSGGPLLNLAGQAIGVNVAIVSGSENIGFALPINDIKAVLESVEKYGRIIRPWIGVRYTMVTQGLMEQNNLPYDYGALVVRGQNTGELAVVPGSPADKAGIVENDIILEINGKKLEGDYTLSKAILEHNVGDRLDLKVYDKGEEKQVSLVLEENK
jgi:serine protease Do